MSLDLAALRRQAEACGDPMALHPSEVLELLNEISGLRAGQVEQLIYAGHLRAKLAAAEAACAERDAMRSTIAMAEKKLDAYRAAVVDADERGMLACDALAAQVAALREALANTRDICAHIVGGTRAVLGDDPKRWGHAQQQALLAAKACEAALADTAQAATEYRERIEYPWRRALWLLHGHYGLYGDDGDMSCSRCSPHFDYKRGEPSDVIAAATKAIQEMVESRGD